MESILDQEQNIQECEVADVLPIITSKWTMPIAYYLSFGSLRFSELKRKLPSMADSNFSKILRELEKDGIIHREDFKTVPPKVEYSLTELGRQLLPVMREIERFGRFYNEHKQDIK